MYVIFKYNSLKKNYIQLFPFFLLTIFFSGSFVVFVEKIQNGKKRLSKIIFNFYICIDFIYWYKNV